MREYIRYFCGDGAEVIVREDTYRSDQFGKTIIEIGIKESGEDEQIHKALVEIEDLEDMVRIFKKQI